MNQRTLGIEKAIRTAKKRDVYKCQVCGKGMYTGDIVCGGHLFPRNSSWGVDPTDSNFIISFCFSHEKEYGDLITMERKLEWLREKGLTAFARQVERVLDAGWKKYKEGEL